MLIVHHLQRSQSERIVWLCEELGIEYELKKYQRDAKTILAPPELASISPTMSAPVIQDGDITLGESGAIVEYIIHTYGGGKLTIPPGAPNYADYLYFLHFSNGYLQPAIGRNRFINTLGIDPSNPAAKFSQRGFDLSLKLVNEQLLKTGKWLAGDELTAADVMTVFSLTTMRLFAPFSLDDYQGIVAYLQRVGARPAYRRAMEKGDPGFVPVLGAGKPKPYGQ